MHHLSKRLCAILLTLCMVIGFLPMTTRAALVDSADYVKQQLVLGDEFVLHLMSNNIPTDYQNQGSAEITYPMGMDGKKVTDTYRVGDVATNDSGYYDVPVERVVAQMADDIKLVVKSDLGVELIDETYSIREYAEALINGQFTSQTKNLCYEMLNYGAAAQQYFNYNTGNLANEDYERAPGYDISAVESPSLSVTTDNLDGIDFYGTTVVFLSEAAVRYYFKAPNGVKGYTFTVNGKEYTPRAKSGLYFIHVPNINPQDMDQAMNVVVTDEADNSLSFTYTPINFFIRSYDKEVKKGEGEGTYAKLMQAAYSYYETAKAFAANNDPYVNELNLTCYTGSANTIQVKTDLSYDSNGMTLESGTGMDSSIDQTQYATGVALSNVDGVVALTFSFAEDFTTGQTYSLPKNAVFKISGKEYVLAEDYVFAFNADNTENLWSTTEPVAESDLLLGFENYAEITGADTGVKLAVGNMLGRMEINVDSKYVSQGVASLKVQPQGNYGLPGKHPYIKLDMSGAKYTKFEGTSSGITTHADFSGYKSISFDVYNPENEAQEIRVGLMIGQNSYVSTNKQKFTLAPNSWTTCTYDLYIMAGFDFYELNAERFIIIEFLDHKENRDDNTHVLYIDDLVGNVYKEGESPAYTDYNYYSGVGYETRGQEYLFIGQGNLEQDATIERVAYADVPAIGTPENGGSYAVKLSHDSNRFPTFRVHFGQELEAGTEIQFYAYGKINGVSTSNQSIFEFPAAYLEKDAAAEATAQFTCGQWTKLEMVLPKDGEYVDLFWNIDRAGITSETASGEVYIDNFTVIQPERAGNILDGLGFEKGGNVAFFGETGDDTDAAPKRRSYASLGINPPDNGQEYGDYVLALSHGSNDVTSRIYFGQTLPAGTEITFMVYGTYEGGLAITQNELKFYGGASTATRLTDYNTWLPISVTLNQDSEYLDIDWQIQLYLWPPSSVTLYIDNLKAVPPAVDPAGNIYQGLTFEDGGNEGNVGMFVAQKVTNSEYKDVTVIRRATYTELGIAAPADGGTYALKMAHDNFAYPAFRLNFGQQLSAGTKIAFQAYVKVDGVGTNNSIFEYTAGGEATMSFASNTWHTLTITLSSAAEYVDLFWNVQRAGAADNAATELYLDNVVVVSGDFENGVGFESVNHTGLFTGQGVADDVMLARVSYADSGITAPADGGTYALKLSNANNDLWPKFRVNFGKTLPAGTLITFDAYSQILKGEAKYNWSIFEYNNTSGSGDATALFNHDEWTALYLVLNEATDHLDLFWNIDRAEFTSETVSAEVYLDNFKAVVPETSASVTLLKGVDFETTGQSGLFVGLDTSDHNAVITRIPYSITGVEAPAGGGEYALRLSHSSHGWPTFRINFGETLPVGTVITYDVFADYTSWHDVTQTVTMLHYAGSGDCINSEFSYNQWMHMSFALTSETDHVDLFWNINNAGITMQNNNAHLYLDNIKATKYVEPVGDFFAGVGFEVEGNVGRFTGTGSTQDATIERVSYADANVTAPANGGTYALKLSHTTEGWPHFRINFGTTLKAGTTITFDAYGNYEGNAVNGNKYMKLELTADAKNYATSADPNQVLWTVVETWKTGVTITLTADCDHLDLMYNVADGQGSHTSSWMLLDNFRAAYGNFWDGVDFEEGNEGNVGLFTGVGGDDAFRDLTVNRFAYNEDVEAPENGGSYGLKLTNSTDNQWPTFKINFGETLPAGTVLTFDAYSECASGQATNAKSMVVWFGADNNAQGGDDVELVNAYGEWTTLSLTLTEATDSISFYWNMDQSNTLDTSKLADYALYLDNFQAFEPVEISGNILEGLDFETSGNELHFGGVDGSESYRNVTIERVSYAEVTTSQALSTGGSYAMKLSHDSNRWPLFRINFGETLPAGTTITFDVLGYVPDAYRTGTIVKIGVLGSSQAYAQGTINAQYTDAVLYAAYNTWTTGCTVKLIADCSYVDLQCDISDCASADSAPSFFLLDNVKATVPLVFTGDFEVGVGLEDSGDILQFTGQGVEQDATIERVSYADAGVSAPTNGGEYALKLSHNSHCWPTFRINFGKTLPAGTTISFDAYGNYESDTTDTKYMKMELSGDSAQYAKHDGNILWTVTGTWNSNVKNVITLTAESDHLDLMYNVADGQHGNVPSWLLLDNIKAVVPEDEAADFEAGVTFEKAGHEDSFTGITDGIAIERVSYADINVTALDGYGDYALALGHTTESWPNFRINFGKTLPAGTTITFDAYGYYDGDTTEWGSYMKVELTADAKTYAESSNSSQVIWMLIQNWTTSSTITLTADSDHLDLFYNVADGAANQSSSWLLLDNIKAVVPEMAFINGVTFEEESHASFFTGTTEGITIERVSYADANVNAPTNGGSYALKVSHTTESWPNFRINFGKTLPAGTTITFDAYGYYDGDATEWGSYMKVELTADAKTYAESSNSSQVIWMLIQNWTTSSTITLTADSDHLDLFYNVADGAANQSSSWLLLDNIKAVEPIGTSLSFEFAAQADYFAGITDGIAIERVSYADANVNAPTNGGTYALKVSHTTESWPNFRINFGKTLPAGTTITFDAYGYYDGDATEWGSYMKVELTADAKTYAESSNSSQVIWMLIQNWTTSSTITLTADSDHLDLFYNVADGAANQSSSWLLLDNFKVTAAS